MWNLTVSTKPLEQIRVLDLTHLLSGPTCTNMLSLLGAEVVKIERPDKGDLYRRYAGLPDQNGPFATVNTGKYSLAIDLKDPRTQSIVRRLIERSDILVENLRPGALKAFGLDWESASRINPRLIYCSISGYGQSGELSDRGGLDQIVQAMSGMMWHNGEPGDGPVKVGWPVIDTFTGNMAALAILAALQKRHLTGTGEFIDVAMLDCALKLMAGSVALHLETGEPPERTGPRGYREVATADIYQTRDGYLSLCANQQHQYVNLCRVLGREDLATDPRFTSLEARVRNSPALREILTEVFKQYSVDWLDDELARAKVPASKVVDMATITHHPHVAQREILTVVPRTGIDKPVSVVGAGFQFGSVPLKPGPVPACGEHTATVLRALGCDEKLIESLQSAPTK